MNKFIASLYLLSPVKRLGLAFLAGVIAAFSMPPYGLFPVLFICFPLMIWLIDTAHTMGSMKSNMKHAFALGWCFGFGYFLNGLWWIGMAFLVDRKFIALAPFAVMLLPAGLALFYGLAASLTLLFKKRGIIPFILLFFVAEMARSLVLTGFPWNLFGYALTQWLPLAQSASIIGVNGLTLLALLFFSTPAMLTKKPVIAALITLIVMAGFGLYRLDHHQTTFHDKIALRLLQPNIPQDAKFNRANRDKIVAKYTTLSGNLDKITHLIWPESAFPFFLSEDKEALTQISKALPKSTMLITGAARKGELLPGAMFPQFFNSVYAINAGGEFLAAYDKVKLVPFGEFLPFQSLLESIGLETLTRQAGGFSAGVKKATITLDHTPSFSPLICYEVIFTGQVTAEKRPAWLLTVTNDAWFGKTPGPHQHFHMASIRAIEEGLPLVRVANNGISGVVDPYGRIIASLALGETGVVDSQLPKPISITFNSVFGLFAQLGMIILLIALYLRKKQE
jgi:apolipoprotein N-acyltransferase